MNNGLLHTARSFHELQLEEYLTDMLKRIKKRKVNRVHENLESPRSRRGQLYADDLDTGRQKCIREIAKDLGIRLPRNV